MGFFGYDYSEIGIFGEPILIRGAILDLRFEHNKTFRVSKIVKTKVEQVC